MTLRMPAVLPAVIVVLLPMFSGACAARHGRAIVGGSTVPTPSGTVSGSVKTNLGDPIEGRRVTAIETTSGTRYDATTSVGGGYTIQVPTGRYRLEVELRAGETIIKQPPQTHVNLSDLDEQLDFMIAP